MRHKYLKKHDIFVILFLRTVFMKKRKKRIAITNDFYVDDADLT